MPPLNPASHIHPSPSDVPESTKECSSSETTTTKSPFENNVVVGRIIDFLIEDPVDLATTMLINKTFSREVVCHLKAIREVAFWKIPIESVKLEGEDDLDSTQPDTDEDYLFTQNLIVFNGIKSRTKQEFARNLNLLVKHCPIESLDFTRVDFVLDWTRLMDITTLKRLQFSPMEIFRKDWNCMNPMITKNQNNLKELRHPEYGFLNNFNVGGINLDYLETDFRSTRPFSFVEDFVVDVNDDYEQKLATANIAELVIYGHNRVRFRELDKVLIDNRKYITFAATDEGFFSEDLYLFKEWKKHKWTFPTTEVLTFKVQDLNLLDMEEVVTLGCCLFPLLKRFQISSNTHCFPNDIIRILIETYRFCRSNFTEIEKTITIRGMIAQKDREGFIKRLSIIDGVKELRAKSTSSEWHVRMRAYDKHDINFFIYL